MIICAAGTGLELLSLDARELQLAHHEMSRRLRAMRSMLTSPSEQGQQGQGQESDGAASPTADNDAAAAAATPSASDKLDAGESLAQGGISCTKLPA